MNLFEILSHDERIIVLSNEGEERIITWNQSLTLQCWEKHWHDTDRIDSWDETNIRTMSIEPRNYREARQAAMEWQGHMWKEREQGL